MPLISDNVCNNDFRASDFLILSINRIISIAANYLTFTVLSSSDVIADSIPPPRLSLWNLPSLMRLCASLQ